MVGVGSQTRNAFSTANTEQDRNGGFREEAIFGWTGRKSLKDLGARHAHRKKLSFLMQSSDEITLYCQSKQKKLVQQLPHLLLWPCCHTKRGRVVLL